MTDESRLKVGHDYRFPDGRVIKVERITVCSATVRPVKLREVQIKRSPLDGEDVAFSSAARSFTISPHSELEEVK